MKRIPILISIIMPLLLARIVYLCIPCQGIIYDYIISFPNIIVLTIGIVAYLLFTGTYRNIFVGIKCAFNGRGDVNNEELNKATKSIRNLIIYIILVYLLIISYSLVMGMDSIFDMFLYESYAEIEKKVIESYCVVLADSAATFFKMCLVVMMIIPIYIRDCSLCQNE